MSTARVNLLGSAFRSRTPCTSPSRGRRSPGIRPGFVLEARPLQRENSPELTSICQGPPLDGPHVTNPAISREMTNNKNLICILEKYKDWSRERPMDVYAVSLGANYM